MAVQGHGKEDSSSDLQQRLEGLCEAFRFDEVLAALADKETGGALRRQAALLLRGRALAGLEQYRTAYDVLTELRRETNISAIDRVEVQLRSARVLRHASPLVDFALQLSVAAADNATRLGERGRTIAIEARVEAALLFTRKRCEKLAHAQLDKARTLSLEDPRVHAGEAEVAIGFDDRPRAKRAFQAAIETGTALGSRLGHLGLARVHTLLGEFERAEAELFALEPFASNDVAARRVKRSLLAARGDWAGVAVVFQEILEAIPNADSARWMQNERAAALYRAGEVSEARLAWEVVGRGEDYAARRARRMLDKTQREGASARRLTAFPSVSQLRNHCGPASVELVMRFFGLAADQVDVAREIKHPDGGTPIYRMRWYLQRSGFVARRIEADLPRLKALIDAGIPVILEEDYSTSRHVAVAVGYDDRRELLEVQDPMTHELRETTYEELPKLREFSNHGALVGVPDNRPDLLAQLDALGALECEYMTKTDEAWKADDDQRYDDADRLTDEAVALHEPYELAWVYRFTRARQLYAQERSPEHKQRLTSVLSRILELWPDDEWPQQFLGRVHELEERYSEALKAFEIARDRDPDDARNYCSVGDCQLSLGREEDAKKSFEQALENDPSHARSNENLSRIVFDAGDTALAEILNDAALELSPGNPFNHQIRGRILADKSDYAGAAAAYDRALELVPGRKYNIVQRARNWAKAGEVERALSSLRALCDEHPKDEDALIDWADIAYEHGQTAAVLEACARLEVLDPEHASSHALAGAARCKAGELEAGLVLLQRALSMSPAYAWVYREKGVHLAAAGRHEEAITAYAANAGLAPSSLATFNLGQAFAAGGFGQAGLNRFKRVAASGDLGERDLIEVARLMRRVSGTGSAHGYFQDLAQQRPRDPRVLLAHIHLLVEQIWSPGAASKVIDRLAELDPEHAFVLAKGGDDLMDASLDLEPKGEALLKKALAQAPALTYPRRTLVRQLNARGRFEEALSLMEGAALCQETLDDRVTALLGLGREAEAAQAIASYVALLPEAERTQAERPLRYQVEMCAGRFGEALPLAEAMSTEAGELPDDGQLSPWEKKRFECLVALGRSEEAYTFGRAQCADAEDLGDLAYLALKRDDSELAARFAREALEKDPAETSAMHVMAKYAELAGDAAAAIGLWERMKEVTGWHIHVENIARVSLGAGDLERALREADAAIATGHVCPVAFQVRAEIRAVAGDRDGARADAERAFDCTQPEWRGRSEDTRGLLKALAGETSEAKRLFEIYLAREKLSPNGRARLLKVMESVGL